MPQEESSLKPKKKMHYLKMASSVFRIQNHYKGLCGGFFLSILAGGIEMKAVSCAGEIYDWPVILKLIPNTLCGSQKEAAKHVPESRKRTQATTSQDAQLNFTKLFEVTVPKRC